jgi:hypothetical protein
MSFGENQQRKQKEAIMTDLCEATKESHQIEFKIAAFGQQSYQCVLCGQWFDEPEDSQP